jgi:hypothetical protein
MGLKSVTNPTKPVHRFNRLYSYFFVLTAALLIVSTPGLVDPAVQGLSFT